jgi:hypothetical protein
MEPDQGQQLTMALCRVFAGRNRLCTFEPASGGPYASVPFGSVPELTQDPPVQGCRADRALILNSRFPICNELKPKERRWFGSERERNGVSANNRQ